MRLLWSGRARAAGRGGDAPSSMAGGGSGLPGLRARPPVAGRLPFPPCRRHIVTPQRTGERPVPSLPRADPGESCSPLPPPPPQRPGQVKARGGRGGKAPARRRGAPLQPAAGSVASGPAGGNAFAAVLRRRRSPRRAAAGPLSAGRGGAEALLRVWVLSVLVLPPGEGPPQVVVPPMRGPPGERPPQVVVPPMKGPPR
ncbi:cuticle collagen 2C-like [Tiliqua scincoides]|uniref:cuticle collagen 2C-like n=1 Tax=Tiliqua scincoides TaxID=71010 RepID=UPI00346371A2